MYCKKCGKNNQNNAHFCAFCGEPLGQNVEDETSNLANMESEKGKSEKAKKSKIHILVALIFLFLIVTAVAFAVKYIVLKQQEKQYHIEIEEGNRYLEEYAYEEAEDKFLEAISVEPKQEEPYLKLAEVYNAQNQPDKVKNILNRGMKETGGSQVQEKYELYTYVEKVLIPEIGWCQDGKYTSKYDYATEESTIPRLQPVHSQKGVLTSLIRDFDADGNEELLVLVMNHIKQEDGEGKWDENAVYLQMYETIEGKVTLQDEYLALHPVMGAGEEEDSGIFIQTFEDRSYICGSLYAHTMVTASGELVSAFVVTYNGAQFEQQTGIELTVGSGEMFSAQDISDMSDYLESIGLSGEASQIRDSRLMRFVFSDSSEEMILRITGAGDGTADLASFWKTADLDELGAVIYYLHTSWDENIDAVVREENERVGSEGQSQIGITSDAYQELYGPLLEKTLVEYKDSGGESLIYYEFDIDKNGVKELLIQTGTCLEDYMYEIYTIEDGKDVYLGEISDFSSSFYVDENGGTENYIIQVVQHMGNEVVYKVFLQNGVLSREEISSREVPQGEDYSTFQYPLPYMSITDKSLL